jgi:PAS domain S-box-containing protein
LPKGHIPVERLLAVPVLLGTELLGEILVANSSREYTDREMFAVQRLGKHYALAIQRVRFKQALQAERDFVEAILATAGALVVVLDPNRRIIRLNPAFQKAMGYQSEEVVGRHFRELFILPEDRQVFDRMFTDLEVGKFLIQGENSLRAKDGSLRRVLWSSTVLLDDRQTMQFVICTGLDVTEVRAVEDKLRVLTRAMEAGPAGVVITNPDGNITYVNRACEILTGYTLQEVLGQTPRVWNSGAHPPEMFVELWSTIKRGGVWRGEICNRKKQGDLFWIHASISPVTDGVGQITHFVAVTIDITKRKQFEQALQQAQQDLERRVDERTADLNTSLAALNLEIEGRRRAEFEIKQLLEFERLVTDISAHFASLKPGLFHATLHEAVSRLMGFLDADAAVLVEFVGEKTRLAVGCYAAAKPHPERLPVEQFPWTFGTLRAQQPVCFSSLTELPAEAQTDFTSYRHASMESVLAIPLIVSQEAIGALVFNTVARQHPWPAEALPRMRIVENLFSTQLLRWRSEQALTEAETRFHAVADFVRDWEYWVSPEGSILFCSPASEHITGHRPEKFLVEPALLHKIVLPEDARIWSEHHADVFGTPQAHNLEFRIRHADGKVRWIQHFSQPVFGEQGQFLGFRVNNRDITQSKETELETQRLHAELAHIARAATVDQLAASLAHELRQPLTAIMSNAEAAISFLNQQPSDIAETREALADIIASNERASEVIRRLRALYRKTDLERGSLDVNKVIEDTFMLLRSELILRQVPHRLELDPALPRASGNRIELQQVLMNLILNAADAMHGIPSSERLLILSTRSEPGNDGKHFRALLYHQGNRDGDGAHPLPLNHQSPRRAPVGRE